MDSFYGGKQGVSFVIKASFKSIDDMVASFKKNEDEGDKPQKKLFSFGKKEEPEENNELKTVENHDEEASNPMLDKILMAVIGVCFVAIIGVLIFILVKVNMG